MALSETQINAVAVALRSHLPFVAYSLPQSSDVTFFADDSLAQARLSACFKIYPWLSKNGYVIADRLSDEDVVERGAGAEFEDVTDPAAAPLVSSTPRDLYIKRVSELVDRLKKRGGKTVYSRIRCGRFKSDKSWLKAIKQLFENPSPNLSAVYFHPVVGAWVTATPEVLLDVDTDTGRFETMSLAGTRPATDRDAEWSSKNVEEQAIVTRYISGVLNSLSLDHTLAGPETVDAGPVQHLRTVISGYGAADPDAIASLLSPTPALGGYPVTESLRDIRELESHQRRCYGGYVAIVSPGSYRAYVNLRCAQFDADSYCLYAGGGITPHSTPADEWDETEAKLSRLLPLFER